MVSSSIIMEIDTIMSHRLRDLRPLRYADTAMFVKYMFLQRDNEIGLDLRFLQLY